MTIFDPVHLGKQDYENLVMLIRRYNPVAFGPIKHKKMQD